MKTLWKYKKTAILALLLILVYIFQERLFVQTLDHQTLLLEREKKATSATQKEPIKIGVSLSTKNNKADKNFQQGVELAIKDINEKGGILGERKLKAIFKEDEATLEGARNVAIDFSKDTDIVAAITPNASNIVMTSSVTYEFSGIVFVATAITNPLFTRDDFQYVFQNVPNDILMGKKLSNLADFLNLQNVVVLHSKSRYGTTLANIFIENGINFGLNISYWTSFSDSDHSFRKIVSDISPIYHKELDYDAIFIAGLASNVPLLIKQLRENGIYAPIITGDNLDSPKLLEIGTFADATIVPTYFNSEILAIETQHFINHFKDTYGFLPNNAAVQGYDAIQLLADAMQTTGSTVPKDVAETLRYSGEHASVSGKYTLSNRGDIVDKDVFFKKVIDNKFRFFNVSN